ncbi:MAG: response regulator [Nannocystaceae bacterium]|nr:response regulator [bacterium]
MIDVPKTGPIAVVDDSASDRFILRRVLSKTSLPNDVIEFDDGPAFLDYLGRVERSEAEAPALLLTDINMPKLNGFELVSKIREQAAFESVPLIVLVTSSEATEDIERAKDVGADSFIPKEVGIERFVRRFEETFRSIE